MQSPSPDSFSGIGRNHLMYAGGGAIAVICLVGILFGYTGNSATATDKSLHRGRADYLTTRPDTNEFDSYSGMSLSQEPPAPADTNFVPPTPEELFGKDKLSREVTRQHNRQPSGRRRSYQRKPVRTVPSNDGFTQAMNSPIQFAGGPGKKKTGDPYKVAAPPEDAQIQQYRREAARIKGGQNPYSQPPAGQGFNHASHEPIPGQLVEPATPYTIMEGTLIPATLMHDINSDLPGNITGFVTRDVYDSIKLKHLLIPKGSKIIGSYDNSVVTSQSKLLLSWDRIIFPDGRSMRLPGLNSQDLQGTSGLGGKVDKHFWRIFGQSAMLSLIGAGTQIATGGQATTGPFGQQSQSVGKQAAQQIATEFNRVSSQVLQRNLNIPPTIKIDAPQRFNIFLAGDISFQQPYEYSPPGQ